MLLIFYVVHDIRTLHDRKDIRLRWTKRKNPILIDGLPDVHVETWVTPSGDTGDAKIHHFKVENNMTIRLLGELESSLVPAGYLVYTSSIYPDKWLWSPSFGRMESGSDSAMVTAVNTGVATNTTKAAIQAVFHEEAFVEAGLTQASRDYIGRFIISL